MLKGITELGRELEFGFVVGIRLGERISGPVCASVFPPSIRRSFAEHITIAIARLTTGYKLSCTQTKHNSKLWNFSGI